MAGLAGRPAGLAPHPLARQPRRLDADRHGRESWDGGTGGACNNFLYRFWHVQVAHAAGGDWRSLSSAYAIKSPVTRIRRAPGGAAFLAAEGPPAFLLLPSLAP